MDSTLADCAAAPSLFCADWTHRIPDAYPVLRSAVDEARYFRPFFPLGAPVRD